MSAGGTTIRCAGCGTIHAASLIRCPQCHKTTRSSREYWARNRPPIDGPIRWPLVIALSLIAWVIISATIWWAYG